jgi:hypothetical protein
MRSLTCHMVCDTKNVTNAESVRASAATLPTLQCHSSINCFYGLIHYECVLYI